ncbi:MAG: hypothetical protein NCA08_06435 [Deltaproteobacteria bacterium]|nr:hypothetical protein [Candidatus Deferrimicrobium borealis]
MIERLFASATMYATLAMFFDFPGDALHARLIARSIGRDVKCVLRQLQTLEACRIIVCPTGGRPRQYRLSDKYPLYREFEALFAKTRDCRYYPRQDGPRQHVDFLYEDEERGGSHDRQPSPEKEGKSCSAAGPA